MPSFHGDHFDGGPCAAEYSIAPEQIQPSCSRTDETGTLFIRITRKALPKKDYRPILEAALDAEADFNKFAADNNREEVLGLAGQP